MYRLFYFLLNIIILSLISNIIYANNDKLNRGFNDDYIKIRNKIFKTLPSRGISYASNISRIIIIESKRYKISPYIIATTAYIESTYKTEHKKPCVGIMQINPNIHKSKRYNIYKTSDNIKVGASLLSAYYHKYKKLNISEDLVLRKMWGKYNGAGPNSKYAYKALKIYKNMIKNNNVEKAINYYILAIIM